MLKVTNNATKKLREMLSRLGDDVAAYRITGFMGTCRGSTPVLDPVNEPVKGDVKVLDEPVAMYVIREYADLMESATLDYDGSFMGKGLMMTWEHQEGCPCQKR